MTRLNFIGWTVVVLTMMAEPGHCCADGIIGLSYNSRSSPVYVETVAPGSPAEEGGLIAGDIITSIDGEPVRSGDDFRRLVSRKSPGDKIVVQVTNPKETLSLTIKVVAPGTKFTPVKLPAAEQEAIAELRDVGADAKTEVRRPGRPIVAVELDWNRINRRTLDYLRGLSALSSLTITTKGQSSEVTLEWLGPIAKMESLRELRLVGPAVTDDFVKACGPMQGVHVLTLERTSITDEAVKYISGCHSQWTSLTILDAAMTDEGLAHLSECTALEQLILRSTQINGTGLPHLHAMTQLRRLDVNRSKLEPGNIIQLAALTSLESLDLSNTAITDNELPHLAPLVKLTRLSLNNTGKEKPYSSPYRSFGPAAAAYAELQTQSADEATTRVDGVTCQGVIANLSALVNLETLELVGPECIPGEIRDMAKMWPKTTIRTSRSIVTPKR